MIVIITNDTFIGDSSEEFNESDVIDSESDDNSENNDISENNNII